MWGFRALVVGLAREVEPVDLEPGDPGGGEDRVDRRPAGFPLLRSSEALLKIPFLMISTRFLGVPSKSKGRPMVPAEGASSTIVTASDAAFCPPRPEKHERPSRRARPP